MPGDANEDGVTSPIFEKLEPTPQMQNAMLAILHAEPSDPHENIRDASVIGFVYVAEVDEKRKKLRVLAPLSGRLPKKVMIWGSWPEGITGLVG